MEALTIEARFDGQVLRPEVPLDLATGTIYKITIERVRDDPPTESIWEILDRHTGSFEGPGDLSTNLDHYLYGTPKREGEES